MLIIIIAIIVNNKRDLKEVLDIMNIILNMIGFNEEEKKELLEIATKLKQKKGMKKSLIKKWLN